MAFYASMKETIDAEFEVSERRQPVSWTEVAGFVWIVGFSAWLITQNIDPLARAALLIMVALIYPARRLLSLLSAPRLQPEEVERLAERLRSNVRGGRGRRLAYSKEPSFRRGRLEP